VAELAHFFATLALRYSCHGRNSLRSRSGQRSPIGKSTIFNAKSAKGAELRHGFCSCAVRTGWLFREPDAPACSKESSPDSFEGISRALQNGTFGQRFICVVYSLPSPAAYPAQDSC